MEIDSVSSKIGLTCELKVHQIDQEQCVSNHRALEQSESQTDSKEVDSIQRKKLQRIPDP
jgi:hypothetical protein